MRLKPLLMQSLMGQRACPHVTPRPRCIALLLFVVYHPLNAMILFPAGRETFFNPVFLFLAALLGVSCTIAYLQSGSIWCPVVIHWSIVIIWLLCLGGLNKLKST